MIVDKDTVLAQSVHLNLTKTHIIMSLIKYSQKSEGLGDLKTRNSVQFVHLTVPAIKNFLIVLLYLALSRISKLLIKVFVCLLLKA